MLSASRFEEAEEALRQALVADPGALEIITSLAASLYYQERFDEAIELWREALVQTSYGEAVYSNGGDLPTAQLVDALRKVGEDDAASEQLEVLDKLVSSVGAAGFQNRFWYFGQTVLAVLKGDNAGALAALQQADAKGFGGLDSLDEPILDVIRDEPAFEIVRQNVAGRAADNRQAVLALICKNNAVPDHWRPLEATCLEFGP